MIEIPTFAAWLEASQSQEFPDVATAWAVYNDRVYRGMQALFADPEVAANRRKAAVAEIAAVAFLESAFGAAWVKEKFPLADHRDDLGPWVQQAQQRQDLARRVFEFQSEPWFADFLFYTETNDVASALFEADVLQTLMHMPAGVTRVTASGVKGQSFDVLLNLARVGDVPVEVKYKQDDTPFSEATVHNTVKGAAKQLPRGHVGWLFIHVPTTWVRPGRGDEYHEALYDGLRQTSRVGVVFTAVDKPFPDEEAGRFRHRRFWDLYKDDSASQELWEAALLLRDLLNKGWDFFAPRAPF
ncbi:hypothetical protein SFUL_6660 [Streptomyces microflavus DSM 40593]|uniref:Uncharacterized protein n=1 Tax=Streptomyces microflavus DSM 40593 TaxID=1303692 RepID=N0D0M3_STRMI|nr:hypothetical protein [Streptomyces microflavus]AGK81540.1 hypothetical protein SFUL_6660 [Streptomyces microflavus DSM 40593]